MKTQRSQKKKIVEFLCSHFKIEDGRKHFQHIMVYYFKKGRNKTETQKRDLCSVWRDAVTEHVKSGLRSFMLEISLQTMLHCRVDQLKLIAIKSRHELRTVNVIPRGR